MSFAIPQVRIGTPIHHKALTVFPLFTESNGCVDYRLADDAIADKSLMVEEVNERGSVPDLLVENKGGTHILFIEGEELIGAKQNRIVNTSILIGANSKVKIPVSCVEQGRWSRQSRRFKSSGKHAPSKMRYAMKKSAGGSARAGRGHRANQGEVWDHVEKYLLASKHKSPTNAMAEAFDAREQQSSQYRDKLRYVDKASGVAVAIGKEVVAIDLFDKPKTCEKVWDRLLAGCIMDAFEVESEQNQASVAQVEELITSAKTADWKEVQSVGVGDEFRSEMEEDQASVLSFDAHMVHGSVVTQG